MQTYEFIELSKKEVVEVNGGITGAEFVGTPADYKAMGRMFVYGIGWVSGFVRGALGLN